MTLMKSHVKVDQIMKNTTQTSPVTYNWHPENIGTMNSQITELLKERCVAYFHKMA